MLSEPAQTDGLVEHTSDSQEYEWRKGKLNPPLLFAYREEQECTGFSPFELLYARDVRGPFDILKGHSKWRDGETWMWPRTLCRWKRLEEMLEHVHKNMKSAPTQEKSKNAWERSFQPGNRCIYYSETRLWRKLVRWTTTSGCQNAGRSWL